eukprot:3879368-Pyramimonas_sp.AAC.2
MDVDGLKSNLCRLKTRVCGVQIGVGDRRARWHRWTGSRASRDPQSASGAYASCTPGTTSRWSTE